MQLKRLIMSHNSIYRAYKSVVFRSLTKLSLGKLQSVQGISALLRNCIQLEDFQLISCSLWTELCMINVAASKIKKLQIDDCNFSKISLRSLPRLETLTCRGRPTRISYGNVPQLRHVSLNYLQSGSNDNNNDTDRNITYALGKFFIGIPPLKDLFLEFKGPKMWVEPKALPAPFSQLRRLFIASVPAKWDIFWIFPILNVAPGLESLHVSIDSSEKESTCEVNVAVDSQQLQLPNLKELVVNGFNGEERQVGFVRCMMKASPTLKLVHLADAYAEEKQEELGNLEIVWYQRKWFKHQIASILHKLNDGIRSQARLGLE